MKKGFASDNNSGVHPNLMNAIISANTGHAIAYGDDELTFKAKSKIKELFGNDTESFFVLTGTGANVLSFASVSNPFHSIICAETAHIHVDECGAPERFTGSKVIPVPTPDGKLSPSFISPYCHGFGFEHHSQPKIISISQSTEVGTVYTAKEIRDIADFAHERRMLLHVDGARIANATASLNVNIKEITTHAGVDILSFGGTKNGMMFGEAIVFFNKNLAENLKYVRKQAMQLYSKMRFVAAQYIEYLENDLWLKNAKHSNEMAQLLFSKIKDISQIKVTQKVQSNAVFAVIPANIIELLKEKYFFYIWNEATNEVRWMCSFDTTEEDVNGFVKEIKALVKK